VEDKGMDAVKIVDNPMDIEREEDLGYTPNAETIAAFNEIDDKIAGKVPYKKMTLEELMQDLRDRVT
jgi:hypothetical protein